jgi:hypothetical protein
MQCATVLERITPGQPATRIKTDFCSTDEAAVRAAVPADLPVLAVFYGGVGFTGASRTVWVPSPCDSVGYSVTDNRARNSEVGGIRSVKLGSAGCNFVQAFSDTNFGGTPQSAFFGLPTVTGALLPHVWSAKMWVNMLPCLDAACQ